MRHAILLLTVAIILAASPLGAASWDFKGKLLSYDGNLTDWAGNAVSVWGDMAAVGVSNKEFPSGDRGGKTYIYRRTDAGWAYSQDLYPVNASAGYGSAVDINGDRMVVGADYETAGGQFWAGAAYVYERVGNTWQQSARLEPSDPCYNGCFGCSVAIEGNRAVVGAYGDDDCGTYTGAAYVFEKQGSTWTQTAKLLPTGYAGDMLCMGAAVALRGNTIAVGSYHDDTLGTAAGAAYIFRGSGSSWTRTQKFAGSDTASWSLFGRCLDLDNGNLVVGAFYSGNGGAYVFKDNGAQFVETQKLTAFDGASGDQFGSSVSVSGDLLLVGSPNDDDCGTNSGSAYLFKRSGDTWTLVRKLTAPDGGADDHFGSGVSLGSYSAFIGAPNDDDLGADAGAAYVFETTPVPEPATLGFLVLGALALLRRKRN